MAELTDHAVAYGWALGTVANIQFAPLIAVHDAVEIAAQNPRSLVRARRELERNEPQTWQAIKCARVSRLAFDAMNSLSRGNLAARAYAGLSRQSTASHLQAILTWPERKALQDLLQILHAAGRVRPLGERIPGACSQVAKSRARGALSNIMKRPGVAAVFQASDAWLGSDSFLVSGAVFQGVISGRRETLEAIDLMRAYSVGDYRWRFLFGYLTRLA